MNEASIWKEVLERRPQWRRTFNGEPSVPDLAGPCPVCNAQTLHRWYLQENVHEKVFGGILYKGRGRLWEWCSTCRTYEHYRDGFVPQWWTAPFDVDPNDLRYDPGPIEDARRTAAEE